MTTNDRPLSPHISVYRWPITMVLSILHRITGLANAAGLVILAAWLVSAAAGPAQYADFTALAGSFVGQAALIALSFSFFYHLANGVRHLFWDAGYGFEKSQANASAWFVIALALLATLGFWLLLP